ncbi:MAG: tetratricopeptide repeat protein [Bacteroidia bacterium]
MNNKSNPFFQINHLVVFISLALLTFSNNLQAQASHPPIEKIRYQADTLIQQGNLTEAITQLEKAFELAISAKKDSLAAAILTDMAEPLTKSGNYQQAITNCLKAAEMYEKEQILDGKAEVYYLLGNIFLYSGDIEQGASYLEKAIDLFKETGNKGYEASAMSNLAMVFNRQGQLEKAESFIRSAIIIKEELADTLDLIRMQMNLAENLDWQGKHQEAIDYMENKAWPLIQNQSFPHEKIAFYQVKGLILKHLKQIKAAEISYLQALSYAESYHFPYMESDIQKNLAKLYQETGQFENALNYYLDAQTIIDSLNHIETQKEIQALREQFEVSEKEREILLLKKEQSISQLKIRLLVVSVILIVIILGGGIFIYRKKRDLEVQKAKQLQTELDLKNQQLTARALEMVRKNDFLASLSQEITEGELDRRKILREIKMHYQMETEWEQFQLAFNEVHTGFSDTLKHSYPTLTANELRHCALLKLGLSIKETASLMGITPASVKVARNRIKKKMELSDTDSLQDFLIKLR